MNTDRDPATGIAYEELRLRLVSLVLTYGADDIYPGAAVGTGLVIGGFIEADSASPSTWKVTESGHRLLSGELNHGQDTEQD